MYVYIFDLYVSVFHVLLLVFSVICMHQGSESNAISILCMYVCTVHVAELTINQTLTRQTDRQTDRQNFNLLHFPLLQTVVKNNFQGKYLLY